MAEDFIAHFYQHVKCATNHLSSTHRSVTKLSLALHLANLTIILSSWFLLTSKTLSRKYQWLAQYRSSQMTRMLCYRTVLLAQTGICSGIHPMALRSIPPPSPASSINASTTSSPQTHIKHLQSKIKSRVGFLFRNKASFTYAAKLTLVKLTILPILDSAMSSTK